MSTQLQIVEKAAESISLIYIYMTAHRPGLVQ